MKSCLEIIDQETISSVINNQAMYAD